MTLQLYMQDLLRQLSAGLLIPVLLILAGLAIYTLFTIGSVIAEIFLQRRHFQENVPAFINEIEKAPAQDMQKIIKDSGMLARQKRALLTVAKNMQMTATDLYALADREIGLLAEQYEAVTSRTDMASKIAPMFGLMGTLIPLGPGIVAMGQGNTEALASSLLVAFDTTVAGLICACVCMVASRLRKHWYRKYMGAVKASMAAILDRAEVARTTGILNGESIEEVTLEVIDEAEEVIEDANVANIANNKENAARRSRARSHIKAGR